MSMGGLGSKTRGALDVLRHGLDCSSISRCSLLLCGAVNPSTRMARRLRRTARRAAQQGSSACCTTACRACLAAPLDENHGAENVRCLVGPFLHCVSPVLCCCAVSGGAADSAWLAPPSLCLIVMTPRCGRLSQAGPRSLPLPVLLLWSFGSTRQRPASPFALPCLGRPVPLHAHPVYSRRMDTPRAS